MRRTVSIILALAAMLSAVSCASRGSDGKQVRHFHAPEVPSVITEENAIKEYILMHFWDDFQGVSMDEVESALSNFIGIMNMVPLPTAQKAMDSFFDKICLAHEVDTSAHTYLLLTQMVSNYLYDPNSPLRNEDFYLPFVRRMASSEYTSPDMRQAYAFEAEACSICPCGSVAPDFVIRTASGRDLRLRDVKAWKTMLFFSNPGCTACKEIIDQVMSCPEIVQKIEEGEIAVVNVYIDEDLKAWREYEGNYPSSWISGYDLKHVIRGERLYDVRAIPSLYLLDREERIIMKDAPTERVIDNLLSQISALCQSEEKSGPGQSPVSQSTSMY